jgi:hypothetical protein
MDETAHVNGALTRLRVVFCAKSGAELKDTDVATVDLRDNSRTEVNRGVIHGTATPLLTARCAAV